MSVPRWLIGTGTFVQCLLGFMHDWKCKRSALQYSLVNFFFIRKSHFVPDQLPGEQNGSYTSISASACKHEEMHIVSVFALSHTQSFLTIALR